MTIREPQCMTWKRRGAEHVRRQVEGMSREEELEFWRKRSEKMRGAPRGEAVRIPATGFPRGVRGHPPVH